MYLPVFAKLPLNVVCARSIYVIVRPVFHR